MTVQVIRRGLGGWIDPAAVGRVVARRAGNLLWLDAGPDARAGTSYIAIESDPVAHGRLENRADFDTSGFMPPADAPQGSFPLGLVGWITYEGHSALARVTSLLEWNHSTGVMTHVYAGDDSARVAVVDSVLAQARDAVASPGPVAADMPRHQVVWRHDDATYGDLVRRAKRHIHDGDVYQLCLTNMATISPGLDRDAAMSVYLRLRAANPSHHGGFMSLGGTMLLSSSPEVFLRVTAQGRAITKPIKGTRPRGAGADEDELFRSELADNVKEQAENVMIVDLMRNDLSRVAVTGSVSVDDLLTVESYANVHQLVSTVSAQLAPGKTAWDALAACFPAGSMTGAPKIAAMRLLAGLEAGERGIYSGAFGFFGSDGSMELAMTIRSLVVTERDIRIGSGGGITSDSVPEDEIAEMHLKVAPLLTALGMR